MRTTTLALLAAALLAGPAAAQQPYPYPNYNRHRAYHHFLTSPAAVKSYSGAQPGLVWGYATPYETVRIERSPAYYREYVSPYRHTIYDAPARVVETRVWRPYYRYYYYR